MKKIVIQAIWNLVSDVVVLCFVWRHAHWSVALLLTVIQLRHEVSDVIKELDRLRVREEADLFVKLRERMAGK